MYQTKIDLAENTRQQLIELLNARLGDAIDLKLQAKQAHWNVKGPSFIALHELFDQVASRVEVAYPVVPGSSISSVCAVSKA